MLSINLVPSNSNSMSRLHLPSLLAGAAASTLGALIWHYAAPTAKPADRPPPPDAAPTVTDPSATSISFLDFFLVVGQLKLQKRTGWVDRGVYQPESVADHQYRMAVMAMTLATYIQQTNSSAAVDPTHCMKIALVHDLAESIVGDITPEEYSGTTKQQKQQLELSAMQQICKMLEPSAPAVGREIMQLWQEYESGSTAAAQLVKDIDKLEMVLQAYEYEKVASESSGSGVHSKQQDLTEFYTFTQPKLQLKVSKQLFATLMQRRSQIQHSAAAATSTASNVAEQLRERLQLEAHPEGGFFKRIYESTVQLTSASGLMHTTSKLTVFPRPASTAIYYMLTDSAFSAIHRIESDEQWSWNLGDDIVIVELTQNKSDDFTGYIETQLGNSAQKYHHTVPAGAYFGSYRRASTHGFVLVTCTVTPGFQFEEWTMPSRAELLSKWAGNSNKEQYKQLVTSLTSD